MLKLGFHRDDADINASLTHEQRFSDATKLKVLLYGYVTDRIWRRPEFQRGAVADETYDRRRRRREPIRRRLISPGPARHVAPGPTSPDDRQTPGPSAKRRWNLAPHTAGLASRPRPCERWPAILGYSPAVVAFGVFAEPFRRFVDSGAPLLWPAPKAGAGHPRAPTARDLQQGASKGGQSASRSRPAP